MRAVAFSTALVLTLLAFGVPASQAAPDVIAVIVHKANPVGTMTRTDLRPIFQTNQTTWPDGSRILPLNLPEGDASRAGFDSAVLGLDPDRVTRYWIDRKIRGGARPPKKVPSAAMVLTVVSKKKEAIGYVPLASVTGDVKVVAKVIGGEVKAP